MKSKYILRDEKVDLVDDAESALPPPMLAGDCSLLSLDYSVIAQLRCHREGRSDLAFFGRANQKERLPRCARLLVIARLICHREGRSDLAFSGLAKQKERLPRCARNDSRVIAREEAISHFLGGQNKKRDCRVALASLSSRGTKRSRFFGAGKTKREIAALRSPPCHREGRSDLAFFGRAKQKERLLRCARLLVIARDEAISPFLGWQNKKRDCRAALASLSSRGKKRSRIFWAGETKREIAALRSPPCHREGRSDLVFLGRAKQKERLPRCARLLVIARDKAISFFWGGQNKKRDCRVALAMTDVIARD